MQCKAMLDKETGVVASAMRRLRGGLQVHHLITAL